MARKKKRQKKNKVELTPPQKEEIEVLEVEVVTEKTVEKQKEKQKTGRKRKFNGLDTKTVRLPADYADFIIEVCDTLSSVQASEKFLENILKTIKNNIKP